MELCEEEEDEGAEGGIEEEMDGLCCILAM